MASYKYKCFAVGAAIVIFLILGGMCMSAISIHVARLELNTIKHCNAFLNKWNSSLVKTYKQRTIYKTTLGQEAKLGGLSGAGAQELILQELHNPTRTVAFYQRPEEQVNKICLVNPVYRERARIYLYLIMAQSGTYLVALILPVLGSLCAGPGHWLCGYFVCLIHILACLLVLGFAIIIYLIVKVEYLLTDYMEASCAFFGASLALLLVGCLVFAVIAFYHRLNFAASDESAGTQADRLSSYKSSPAVLANV